MPERRTPCYRPSGMPEGSVPERRMRYLIEDLAAAHPAVHDVDNRITVRKS